MLKLSRCFWLIDFFFCLVDFVCFDDDLLYAVDDRYPEVENNLGPDFVDNHNIDRPHGLNRYYHSAL